MTARIETVSLVGKGWPVVCPCIAVVRLRGRAGFAVGVQAAMRQAGVGRVWPTVRKARRRAAFLSNLHSLPIVEAL